jgi:hypothetical protein
MELPMLKDLPDRLFHAVILVLATFIALYFAPQLDSLVTDPNYRKYLDIRFVVPIASGMIYLLLLLLIGGLLKIPSLRRAVDDKYAFCATYVSFPKYPDEISVFTIKSGLLRRKYQLEGVTYSLLTKQATGSWSSDLLDMNPKTPARLTYIYSGYSNRVPAGGTRKFSGHGYSKIEFTSPELKQGSGYFVDDADDLDRQFSNYHRFDREFRKTIKRSWWRRGKRSIVRAIANLPPGEQAQYRPGQDPGPPRTLPPSPPTTFPVPPA